MNLKKAIKIAMVERDISQKKLSDMACMGQGHLSLIINGKRSATIPTVQKLAKVLDMKLSELIALGE